MRWYIVTLMCLIVGLMNSACSTKPYERHIETAYTQTGQARAGYITINSDYMEALNEDLQACYRHK